MGLGLLMVLASAFASGSYAAATPTLTVQCINQYYGLAVFSWTGVPSGGFVVLYAGSNTIRLTTPPKSGKFEIEGFAIGPPLYAHAQIISAPDKTGSRVLLGEAETPNGGCQTY